ncbi:MAG: WecB/TagA/CpsF family glycosyltransferase [Oceanospirillaceae bacterium]|nr:WecB/TagA/CpsF family glycosyltransferase [Oceanospirillaceae bacterium]
MEHVCLLGYRINKSDLSEIPLNEKVAVNCINAHAYAVAKKDELFQDALKECDVLIADGVSVVWANKLINGGTITKQPGFSLHMSLLERLNKSNGTCFYLGAANKTLELIHARIENEFPNVSVRSFSPPYVKEFSKEQTDEMILKVNEFSPQVLFVGMTAPKQEKWVHNNLSRLEANVICSIGAAFDFYAGTVERPNELFLKMNLEWLGRLLKEPRRMWRRNFISTPIFIKDVIKTKLIK